MFDDITVLMNNGVISSIIIDFSFDEYQEERLLSLEQSDLKILLNQWISCFSAIFGLYD